MMAMTAGYQHDPIAEHAIVTELAAAVSAWQTSEAEARAIARRALTTDGVRADVIADALGMSRSTLYRWLRD